MKNPFVIVLTVIISAFAFSCSTFHSNFTQSKEITGRDLPPALIRDLTLINNCQDDFWQSPFGQLSLLTPEQFNKASNKFDAERKPACSLDQALKTASLIGRMKTSLWQELDSKKTSSAAQVKLLKKVLMSETPVLLRTNLSMVELMIQTKLLNQIIQRAQTLKNPELDTLIKTFAADLKKRQDDILKASIHYDILIAQNTAYRLELYDWSTMGLGTSDVHVATDAELDALAKQNKYAEVLNLEKFKTLIAQNFECLKGNTCVVCETAIEAKTCGSPRSEQQVRDENLLFLKFISPNIDKLFTAYYKETNEILSKY